jgi:uncharacterized protein (DUF983 family)
MVDERHLRYEARRRNPFDAADLAAAIVVCGIGLIPLLIGLRWLQVFIFTDYRAHFRPIMIPLGLVATSIGLAMVLGPWVLRWIVRTKT